MLLGKTLASPYVKERPPSSTIVSKLLDDEQAAYEQKTLPKPKTRDTFLNAQTKASRALAKHMALYHNKDPQKMISHQVRQHRRLTKQQLKYEKNEQAAKNLRTTEVDYHKFYHSLSFHLTTPKPEPKQEMQERHNRISSLKKMRRPQMIQIQEPIVDAPQASPGSKLKRKTPKNNKFNLAAMSAVKRKFLSNGKSKKTNVAGPVVDDLAVQPTLWTGESTFSEITFPTAGTYDLCFKADWHLAKMEDCISDAVDRKRVCRIMQTNYPLIVAIFRHYAATFGHSHGNPYKLWFNAAFLEAYGLDPAMKLPVKESEALSRSDFLRLVVHIAITKSLAPEAEKTLAMSNGMEYSESIKHLIVENFRSYANVVDVNVFRNYFFLFEDIEELVLQHQDQLCQLFNEFTLLAEDGKRRMEFGDFFSLLRWKKQLSMTFRSENASTIFIQASTIEVRENTTQVRGLNYAQFLEAIGRIAYHKHQATLEEAFYTAYPNGVSTFPAICNFDDTIDRTKSKSTKPPYLHAFKEALLEQINSLEKEYRSQLR